jgi:hypothetical protein
METPYNICGGLQDNGTGAASRTLSTQGIRKNAWVTISGRRLFAVGPRKAMARLPASQGGGILLTDMRTGDQRSIHPDPNRGLGR